MTKSDKCSAIEAATHKQDVERLDLDGIWGGEKWDPAIFRAMKGRCNNGYFNPRVYSVIADETYQPLLVCYRIRQHNGFDLEGHSLKFILEAQDGLTERALKANMHTGYWWVFGQKVVSLSYQVFC